MKLILMPEEPPPFASETEKQTQVVKELNWPSFRPVATWPEFSLGQGSQ